MLVFEERGKPEEYPEKNLSEQGREPTTNSTHINYGIDAGIWIRATLVGDERSHRWLRHPLLPNACRYLHYCFLWFTCARGKKLTFHDTTAGFSVKWHLKKGGEIPFWWHVLWIVFLIGWRKFSANQKLYPASHVRFAVFYMRIRNKNNKF